jgi:hypothetical protein
VVITIIIAPMVNHKCQYFEYVTYLVRTFLRNRNSLLQFY